MSTPRHRFSDEILNAYIDGELSPEDSAHITEAMISDEVLRRRVEDLNRVSEMVRAAFSESPLSAQPPERQSGTASGGTLWRVAATVAFISLGGLLGWHMVAHNLDQTERSQETLAQAQLTDQGLKSSIAATDPAKMMFHVGRKDMALFGQVLTEVDRLLAAADLRQPVHVRVIASHGGLALFDLELQQNAERVQQMKLKYAERIDFIGCGETYAQWKKSKSKKSLLPEMVMVDSGVRELLRSQQGGWTFVPI